MVFSTTGGFFAGAADGEIPDAAHYFACCQVYAGGALLRTTYTGAAPGIVAGVVQINLQIPEDAEGLTYLTLTAGNRVSSAASIFVAQTMPPAVSNAR